MEKNNLIRELQKIEDVLEVASKHFKAESEMNAALHMSATVRITPLGTAVINAKEDLAILISHISTEEES